MGLYRHLKKIGDDNEPFVRDVPKSMGSEDEDLGRFSGSLLLAALMLESLSERIALHTLAAH
jgi:hypothetical protein